MTGVSDPDVMNVADAVSVSWRTVDGGERLTYVERETGTDTIWEYRSDIRASERVVSFDDRVSGRWGRIDWNADGTKVTYTRGGDVHVYDTETGAETTPAPSDAFDSEPRWAPSGDELAFISGRGDANDVWRVNADGTGLERVTEGANPHDDKRWEPSWSPDGDSIAYVAADEWHGRDWADEAHVVHLPSGKDEQLTTGLSVTSVPSWGPDGERVAFFTKRVAEPWYRHSEDIHVVDLRTGTRRVYPVEASHRYNVQQPLWAPDGGKLYYPVRERGTQQLEAILLHNDSDAEGVPTRLTVHDGVFGAGPVRLSPSGDTLGFVYAEQDEPSHIRRLSTAGGDPERLRAPDTPDGVVVPENVTYESFDGMYINAYVYKPDEVDETNPAPTLVQVHGGAHFQFGNGWHPMEQYLAARGFVVVGIDFRGSGGYGRSFQELSMGDWEGGEVKDAREAARFARDLPYTTDEVGIYGGSWGGFMTLQSISQYPDVWDAAVEWYGVVNQFTDYEAVDRVGRLLTERDLGGSPEQVEERYHGASSHWRLDEVTAPLAVLHGADDERVPINQAEELIDFFEGGPVPFEATIYESEGHGFRDAENRRDAVRRTADWFDRHLG
ncbi:S9 family peptidase (plasmid) [Halorussus salilacus]|uniref:S9 family peptidase n=1 Tax=Halorussus salilacus TaxID=2953750 RepID=UPI0020A1CB21|nr:S9 family peptidase [Halorussus salilacus]USZ70140.1 S9 family peptidase [Halorussus salilacus]